MLLNDSMSTFADNVTHLVPLVDCGLPLGDCDILRQVKKVMLSLAVILNVATFVCIVILKKWETFRERLFVHLMLANFFFALVGLGNDGFPEAEGTPACTAQGFFDQILDLVKFLWIAVLTIYLYNLLVKDRDTEHFEWLYTAVCWVLPVSVACLPLTTNDYGLATAPYCWIKGTFSGNIWRITIFYIPIFGGLFVIMIVFFYMFWHAAKANTRFHRMTDAHAVRHREIMKDYLKPLTAYAVTFTVLNFFRFLNRMHQIDHPPQFGLILVHLLASYSFGIFLSTLFFITHGRQEFTLAKFKAGIKSHRKFCTYGKKPAEIRPFPVEPGNPHPSPQPDRRDNGGGNRSNNAHDNDAFARGDIRSFDINCSHSVDLDSD